jgi:hypothetical protein
MDPFWKPRQVGPQGEQTSVPYMRASYPMTPPHDADQARQRVRELVEALRPDGVDEGTGAALDPLIQSWTAGWLAGIDAEHTDHTGMIDVQIGSAKEQLARAQSAHDHDLYRLELARRDHTEARRMLGDDSGSVRVQPAGPEHATRTTIFEEPA